MHTIETFFLLRQRDVRFLNLNKQAALAAERGGERKEQARRESLLPSRSINEPTPFVMRRPAGAHS